MTSFANDTVYRIDPETHEVVAEIEVGANPEGLLVTDDAVWVANHRGGSISQIDPATNAVVATLVGPDGPAGPKGIIMLGGDLWTVVPNMGSVVRLDPASGEVVSTFTFPEPDNLVADAETMYVFAGSGLSTIDPATNEVNRVGDLPELVPNAFADGSAWAVRGTDLLAARRAHLRSAGKWRISDRDIYFGLLAIGDGSVWLAFGDDGWLVRVDPGL